VKLTELFTAELDSEAELSKKALERAPDGQYDWKPHETSMTFGYLAELVATMPSWVAMAIRQDELDLNPPGGSPPPRAGLRSSRELIEGLTKAAADARAALKETSDEHLMTPWKLLFGGKVVMEKPRHVVIRDTFNHLAHHRGQMTVYLRLLGAPVPALYGPSADDRSF
jgi:hypothetical protein